MNNFEILLRRFKIALQNNSLDKDTLYKWLFTEEEGMSYAHHLLQDATAENIQWIFSFVSDFSEGKIFNFLMLRDLEANTIGHIICCQAFSDKHDVIGSQILKSFLNCIKKLPIECRQDLVSTHNQSGQSIDDIIKQTRVDEVKREYRRALRNQNVFTPIPLEIFIPVANPQIDHIRTPVPQNKKQPTFSGFLADSKNQQPTSKKSSLPPLPKINSHRKRLSYLAKDLAPEQIEKIEEEPFTLPHKF